MIPTSFCQQILEELLVVDPRHAADFSHLGFGRRVPVDKVGRDADGQFAPQLLVFES